MDIVMLKKGKKKKKNNPNYTIFSFIKINAD